jgi:hypothetical protein
VRGVARRSRQVSGFRRQRLPVDVHPEEAREGADEGSEDDEAEKEKIEVHVHVHRPPDASRPKKRPLRSTLTGVLFDWQGHYDRVCLRPQAKHGRWSRVVACPNCQETIPFTSKSCRRCGAPRSLRGLGKVIAALGLGIVVLVFALCAHMLGDSVAEHRPPPPTGDSSDAPWIIEMPSGSSPLDAARFPAKGSGLYSEDLPPMH